MKNQTIARNYAEALLAAADAEGQVEPFGQLIDAVAGAVRADERIAVVLESPRVAKTEKGRLLEQGLRGAAPKPFIRFLQAVVRRGRQGLLSDIATEYHTLVDLKLDRVHAGVTLTAEPDARLQQQIVDRLTKVLKKEVRAHFRGDPAILGGVMVRVGDRVYDGSIKRRLNVLRRRMLMGE